MYRNSAALCAAAAILLAACGSENGLVTSAAPIVAASRGVIVLDAPTYRSPAVVTITVADSDLNRHRRDVETFRVGITSNVSTYGEAPLLTETGPDTGIFTGTVPLRTRSYEPGRDGILDVMPGDTIVATYIDRNDGTGHEVTVTATATVDATPDIVADFVSLSVSGAVASITDRVHADENGAAVPAFSARVFLSTDPVLDGGDLLIRERSVAGMTRGSSADTQTIVQLSELTPGTYYAIAVYDVYDQVTEWSESNNVVVSAQTVFVSDPPPPAPEPDLVEDYVKMATSVGSATIWDRVSVPWTSGAASAFVVRLYLSPNTTLGDGDDILVGERTVPGLAPSGFSYGATAVQVDLVPPGYYFPFAVADADGVIAESNETNNVLFYPTANYVGP